MYSVPPVQLCRAQSVCTSPFVRSTVTVQVPNECQVRCVQPLVASVLFARVGCMLADGSRVDRGVVRTLLEMWGASGAAA